MSIYNEHCPTMNDVVSDLYSEILFGLSGVDTACIYRKSANVKDLISPSERDLLERVTAIGSKYCEIKHYIDSVNEKEIDGSSVGLYELTFVEYLDKCLEPYRNELVVLEELDPSLCTLYSRLYNYEELLCGLSNLAKAITLHNSRGTSIVEKIYEHFIVSTRAVQVAFRFIYRGVSRLMFNQLKSWILYGELIDNANEFFIKKNEGVHHTPFEEYGLNCSLLPVFIQPLLAEKILSAGQTVLFLTSCPNHVEDESSSTLINSKGVARKKAGELAKALIEAELAEPWQQWGLVERVVLCVTNMAISQLHSVALQDADLIQQIHMVKDLFLMGRGELFHEFVSQTDGKGPNSFPDWNVILQSCGRKVHLNEDALRPFRLEVQRSEGFFSFQYAVPWPLQLLFTNNVLLSYNHIFRFLLRLKIIQVKMSSVWLHDKSNRKKTCDSKRRQLQQNLWFLVNNLQYYLQVDVLDSQFDGLLTAIKASKDFDEIRSAHSKFLANLITQSFLDSPESNSGIVNPVQQRMSTILKLCEEYCKAADALEFGDISDDVVNDLSDRCETCFECLFAFLAAIKKHAGHPCSRPLGQLLLRLDFNHFYSQRSSQTASIAAQFF